MEKYDAGDDVFDEFIRRLLASFQIRYDAEAWQALQAKLDKKLVESRVTEKASEKLKNPPNGNHFNME